MDAPHAPSTRRLIQTSTPPRPPRRRSRRWWLWGIPAAGVTGVVGLVALAPPLPQRNSAAEIVRVENQDRSFRYLEEPQTYVVELDPRRVGFDLFEGWDREEEAYRDRGGLAFVSGPMYERHVDESGQEITLPLGDIKFGDRIWRGRNLSAARERAFVGIRHDGQVEFSYGQLTPARAQRFDTFIGGLHSIYNDTESPPSSYKGAYSLGMGQQIRYYLPRIRVIYGLRPDGRLEILMSREGLTLEETRALARQRGLVAAYLPDHASKSRLIVPGVKGFSSEDANWISGGATSFVHVPYMLKLERRAQPLHGSLLASLSRRLPASGCGNPLQCGQLLAGRVADRLLSGLNRVMEGGVEPLARLFWAPRHGAVANRAGQMAPFREPVITADPGLIRLRQQEESKPQPDPGPTASGSRLLPAAPELPRPAGAVDAPSGTEPGSAPAASPLPLADRLAPDTAPAASGPTSDPVTRTAGRGSSPGSSVERGTPETPPQASALPVSAPPPLQPPPPVSAATAAP